MTRRETFVGPFFQGALCFCDGHEGAQKIKVEMNEAWLLVGDQALARAIPEKCDAVFGREFLSITKYTYFIPVGSLQSKREWG